MKHDDGRQPEDLRLRTKRFALRVIRLYSALPKTTVAQVLGKQVLRSATSVGAHYREAKRARSSAELVSRIETALQELDETGDWLELLGESEVMNPSLLRNLQDEVEQLTAIPVTVVKTTKRKRADGTRSSRTK